MMLKRHKITFRWRLFLALSCWWRWLRTAKELHNHDLSWYELQIMEGPRPPSTFASNGSTFSPDCILGVDVRPAAHIHDYCYQLGGTESQRKDADYTFYRNLVRCGLSRWLARRYFFRVRFWGVHCFKYTDNSRPRGWARAALFFNRYVEF